MQTHSADRCAIRSALTIGLIFLVTQLPALRAIAKFFPIPSLTGPLFLLLALLGIALVLNPPSFDRFEPSVKKDGVLIVNTSLVSAHSQRTDIRAIYAPANDIGSELGAMQLANVVMVGALVAATGMVKFETLDQVLDEHVSARHRDKLEANKKALRRGAALAKP